MERRRELYRLATLEPRPVEQRLVGICRHFSVFAAAALRVHGIPAHARCGFGAYFNATDRDA